ncbi:uncharacterized protein DFL_004895 [Arthrobotrys flagrans]|uniref:Uncharacterized protein n=1 Tax=Arthrobotrys flagrans TaxID=97331 RepID=A0A437A658_ARTFL|nr:hypothetical protein DFL_004895 [Arthrobotrys flagrans]
MANQQNPHPALVIKTYESITFTGNRHIRSRQGQRIELVARRNDGLEITFPSPTSRQVIRFTMNSKYVTIYWAENTASLVLYVNDKHVPAGYPKVEVRNETGFRGWTDFSNDANIHTDIARLLGTQVFGNNRLMALQWNRYANSYDLKPLRKAICHTKWQNLSSIELRRRCMHMMEDAGMTFGHYFKGLPAAGTGPSIAPTANAGTNAPNGANTNATTGANAATVASAPAGATIPTPGNTPTATVPAAGNISVGTNAPAVKANVLGTTNAPTGSNNVAATKFPAGTNPVATADAPVGTNARVTTNAPVTGANTVATANGQAGANTFAGPSVRSAAVQDAPPMEPKRPVTWYPLTIAHMVKAEPGGSRVYHAITAKQPGTIRPPAVFHFDDSDPFGTTPSESKVTSIAEVPPMAQRGIVAPPPLPPLPPQLAARLVAIPKERRAVEATESLTETRSTDIQVIPGAQYRNIPDWQEGLARAETEETPLPGPPSGMLIDFGGNLEVSAPQGEAVGGEAHVDTVSELVSELAGLVFGPAEKSDAWEDIYSWRNKMDYPQ